MKAFNLMLSKETSKQKAIDDDLCVVKEEHHPTFRNLNLVDFAHSIDHKKSAIKAIGV